MPRVLVACGGSGDLITALSLVRSAARRDTVALATPVWERHALDPRPGPRGLNDLTGLDRVAGGWRVTRRTRTPGGYSPLARFSVTCGLPLFFLDLTKGATGLHHQLQRLVRAHRLVDVELVDTGGDALARGTEPGLVSPATDALLMAAARDLPCRTWLTCAGLGLDGELTPDELRAALADIPPAHSSRPPAAVAAALYRALRWFPSEAALITLLAACGLTGTVDLARHAPPVAVSQSSAVAHTFPLGPVAGRHRLTRAVADSSSFLAADRALRAAGARSEYQAELDKPRPPGTAARPDADAVLRAAHPLHGDFVSLRRLAGSADLHRHEDRLRLDRALSAAFGAAYRRPLLRTAITAPRRLQDQERTPA